MSSQDSRFPMYDHEANIRANYQRSLIREQLLNAPPGPVNALPSTSSTNAGSAQTPHVLQTPLRPILNPAAMAFHQAAMNPQRQLIQQPHGSVQMAMVSRHPSSSTPSRQNYPGAQISNQNQSHRGFARHNNGFQSSRMVRERQGQVAPLQPYMQGLYQGDPNSRSSRSQVDRPPDHLNTVLWIEKIPETIDLAGFLFVVRTGAVYACHMKPPRGGIPGKACKLEFFTNAAAAAFKAQIERGLLVSAWRLKVVWNEHGRLEDPHHAHQTRVILLRGPRGLRVWYNGGFVDVWTRVFWERFFTEKIVYQLEGCRELLNERDWTQQMFEFRFSRVNAQSEAIYLLVVRNPELFKGMVQVWYGPDPCDPNSGFREDLDVNNIEFGRAPPRPPRQVNSRQVNSRRDDGTFHRLAF